MENGVAFQPAAVQVAENEVQKYFSLFFMFEEGADGGEEGLVQTVDYSNLELPEFLVKITFFSLSPIINCFAFKTPSKYFSKAALIVYNVSIMINLRSIWYDCFTFKGWILFFRSCLLTFPFTQEFSRSFLKYFESGRNMKMEVLTAWCFDFFLFFLALESLSWTVRLMSCMKALVMSFLDLWFSRVWTSCEGDLCRCRSRRLFARCRGKSWRAFAPAWVVCLDWCLIAFLLPSF